MENTYSFNEHKGIQILTVSDLIIPESNQQIISAIEQKISENHKYFVINLEKLSYINSSGLSFLISILTRSRTAGGEVAIANLSENVKKLLLITRLQSAFSIHDNIDEAADALCNKIPTDLS